jgi:hypothetical protein
MKNIIFFGDSFACCLKTPSGFGQRSSKTVTSYIDLVAKDQQSKAVCFGFGGVSWWYSYVKLKEWIESNPEQWQNTEAMVMCLTNSSRPKLDVDKDVARLYRTTSRHYLSFYNEQYERWCYSKFLDEVVAYDKKIIVLPCFDNEVWISEQYRHSVSACAMPLIHISNSEWVENLEIKTVDDIHQLTANDQRANHFSNRNNCAIANDIIKQLRNYQPGLWMPDKKNYDIKNSFFDIYWQQAQDLVNKYSL